VKFFLLRSEIKGFVSLVSLWSEAVNFICETKRNGSETKRKRRSETKRKKRTERNKAKISENNILKRNEEKTVSNFFCFEAKQKKKAKKCIREKNNAEAKKNEAKRKEKTKLRKWNKAKRKVPKRKENTQAKRSEKKNLRSEKKDAQFSLKHAKEKRNGSRFASFCFVSKRNKIWSETGAPYPESAVEKRRIINSLGCPRRPETTCWRCQCGSLVDVIQGWRKT
jgi:hypothetical protein